MAPIRTKKPAVMKPPRKLMSLRVVSTYADRPKKTRAVMAKAELTTSPPLGKPRYMLRIGPRV
ncbi:hypothetical protein D9M68_833820 [compost metagenome]